MSGDAAGGVRRSPAHDAAIMTVAALMFAEQARPDRGRRLDFAFASVGLLDQIITRTDRKPELIKQVVAPVGFYLGEVVLDFCGGTRGPGSDLAVILPPAHARPAAMPLDCGGIAVERMFDSVSVTERVVAGLQTWFGPDFTPADPIDPVRLPEMARRRAEAFVDAASDFGVDAFDRSPESIELVDRYVDECLPRGLSDAGRRTVATMAGCYVGEALVAATGAHWILTAQRQLALELRGTAFPVDKVAKRIAEGSRHSVDHFYREISAFWLSAADEPPATWARTKAPKRRFFGR